MKKPVLFMLGLIFTISAHTSKAALPLETSGKLSLTGGVSQLEGSAGGGLTPWAIIGGYGTEDEIGANAFYSSTNTQDFGLDSRGVLVGFYDKIELSYAQQVLNLRGLGTALGLGENFKFKVDVFGIKIKIVGDAILDQDQWLPQISIGAQFKHIDEGHLVKSLGARSEMGTDIYVSATKLYLNQSVLANLTLRATKANQIGLLGFGQGNNDDYSLVTEASIAYLVNSNIAAGFEYRAKPNKLPGYKEDNWSDVFLAWAPTKNISLTLAYVNLGEVATKKDQTGTYGSIQIGF